MIGASAALIFSPIGVAFSAWSFHVLGSEPIRRFCDGARRPLRLTRIRLEHLLAVTAAIAFALATYKPGYESRRQAPQTIVSTSIQSVEGGATMALIVESEPQESGGELRHLVLVHAESVERLSASIDDDFVGRRGS